MLENGLEFPRSGFTTQFKFLMATTVNFKGSPVELSGTPPQVGDAAPAFDLVDNSMNQVHLEDTNGKVRILSIVPSIDTSVCSIQTQKFNQALDQLPESVIGYTISIDTPFAQKRWCGAEGVEKMSLLSDYKGNNFGKDYGLYIADLGLLARSVFVIDGEGKVVYTEIVPEISQEPDYDQVIAIAKQLVG